MAQRLFLQAAVRRCGLEQAREVVLPRAVLKACMERAGVLCVYIKAEALSPPWIQAACELIACKIECRCMHRAGVLCVYIKPEALVPARDSSGGMGASRV